MGAKKEATPKTYKIRVSHNALQNIDEITGYIALINQQPLNAIKVGDSIFKTIDRIAKNPLAFKECKELPTKTKMYRRALCLSWSIIYRISNTDIVILGIINQSRWAASRTKLRKIK